MKNRIILFVVVIVAAALFTACGGATVTTNTNTNAAKPANSNSTANSGANTASNTASSNSTSNSNSSATGNAELDFTVVNKTGYDIKALSVGVAGDKTWEPEDEVLKGRALKDGDSVKITFHPKETATNWDIRVEWADGDTPVEWYNLNLTKIETVTLKYDKASGKTTAEID